MTLELQINPTCADRTAVQSFGRHAILLAPRIDESYWLFRVPLSEKQAVVGFPKFGTIGIGFQDEEDWNANLPYQVPAEAIYAHIKRNKGDEAITDARCLEAIRLIQAAAAKHQAALRGPQGEG